MLFVPLFERTPRLDPLYPCAWQTKFLSKTSQFATQRSFHVPLLKNAMDPLEGQSFVLRKLTGNSKKKKNCWEHWLDKRNDIQQMSETWGGGPEWGCERLLLFDIFLVFYVTWKQDLFFCFGNERNCKRGSHKDRLSIYAQWNSSKKYKILMQCELAFLAVDNKLHLL